MRTIRLKVKDLANMLLKRPECLYRCGNQFMVAMVGPSCIILDTTTGDLNPKARYLKLKWPDMQVEWSPIPKHGYTTTIVELDSIEEFRSLSKALKVKRWW